MTADRPHGAEPGPSFGLADLRGAMYSGRSTPHDVVDAVLARLAERSARHPHIWITLQPEDDLRRRAEELIAIRRERDGDLRDLTLYGVPFAVKDNIDVRGLPTTAGCPAWARRPGTTATAVRRLLAAGALLVGKTNLDQFATGLVGVRSPYGPCESVFGGRLVAGGSSSGSAVAVAAGLVSFALGTDTAGSGRVPAAMNGIVGLKPTRGLVSNAGVVPACRSLDCVSVLATSVSDAAEVLSVAQGYDPADPWSRRPPANPGPVPPAAALRLGVPLDAGLDFFGDEPMRRAFERGRDRVLSVAASAAEFKTEPLLDAGDLLYRGPWIAERLADLGDFLRSHPDDVLPVTREVLESGRRFDAVDLFRATHRLQRLRRVTEQLWDGVDALVLPTIGTTFTIEQIAEEPVRRNLLLGHYTQFANLLDLAVVTIPDGRTEDGRPASLSLIGPAFSEAVLVGLAGAVMAESTVRDAAHHPHPT